MDNQTPPETEAVVNRVTTIKDPKRVEAGKKGALVKKLRKTKCAHSKVECANSSAEHAHSMAECAHSKAESSHSISKFAGGVFLLGLGVGIGMLYRRGVSHSCTKHTDDSQLKAYNHVHYMR